MENQKNYEQLKKNTVDSKNQLKETKRVRFIHGERTGKRVLFVGNSITLHGVSPSIGWHYECGMAASCQEKDYVHLLVDTISEIEPDACFGLCQVAEWERRYKNGSETYEMFEAARDFEPDVIVARFIENCPHEAFEPETFRKEYEAFVEYLDALGKAKVIVTTSFWKHPGDDTLRQYAEEKGFPCVELGDLGERDEMKAIGLFEHEGVAAHPGDLGMQHIADRIFAVLKEML